jgi:hypothetical protein
MLMAGTTMMNHHVTSGFVVLVYSARVTSYRGDTRHPTEFSGLVSQKRHGVVNVVVMQRFELLDSCFVVHIQR